MTQTLLITCRILLFAALVPTGLMAVLVFATVIWFSPIEYPAAFLFALALFSGPFWVLRAIMLSDELGGKRLVVQTATIWATIAVYALFVSELLPSRL